uniref:Uncharacterized protein n=1 Tax=Eutreptiella gymnastica TaxID=73025 RepID=A0A7S1ID33_9EUGL|mmetsp:Transcript_148253/g.259123  ORF Transcript_148253/g.259123 Transcript_148253/m.259123 type:complete len:119 (+) Transcript_148253:532-888(+)
MPECQCALLFAKGEETIGKPPFLPPSRWKLSSPPIPCKGSCPAHCASIQGKKIALYRCTPGCRIQRCEVAFIMQCACVWSPKHTQPQKHPQSQDRSKKQILGSKQWHDSQYYNEYQET